MPHAGRDAQPAAHESPGRGKILFVITTVDSLLSLPEGDTLEAALAAAGPAAAVAAIRAAPTLERKTALLWALDDAPRRAVLERLPAGLVAALVQNLEEDNQYLLGDLSLEQYHAILALCSAERKFYWVTTALGFTDARANALPLLLTTRELAEILLTRPEFEDHLNAFADYPIEDARVTEEMLSDPAQAIVDLLGPVQLLKEFPIQEPGLARMLQTLLDYDPDRYVDLVREGLRQSDYAENHPLEWETLVEEPVLLTSLSLAPGAAEAADADESGAEVAERDGLEGPPLSLVPVAAPPLARLAASLAPGPRVRVAETLQHEYLRQAVAEGGSFLRDDLERAARSVDAYLLLGLEAESGGDPAREEAVLVRRPLARIAESGARRVEALRQVALRLRPLDRVLGPEERVLVRSLLRPRLTLGADGRPRLRLLPGGTQRTEAGLPEAAVELGRLAAWTETARAWGLDRTEAALRAAGSFERLLEELALGAVLYARLEPGLVEEGDLRRFAVRYAERATEQPTEAARAGLRRVTTDFAAARGASPEPLLELLDPALNRLAPRALES